MDALSGAQAQRALALFFLIYFFFIGVLTPYFSLYLHSIGQTALQIGVLTGLIHVLRIVGPPLWGHRASAGAGAVPVMRFLALGSFVASLVLAFQREFLALLFALIGLHFFLSGLVPLADAAAMSATKGNFQRYGRLRLWGSIGFVTAVMAGGWVVDQFGLRAFMPMAIACLLLTAGVTWLLPHTRSRSAAASKLAADSAPASARPPGLPWFLASAALIVAAHAGLYSFVSLYLQDQGYSAAIIGRLWAIGVITEIVFFYWQGRVLQWVSVRLLLHVAFAAGIVRFGGIAGFPGELWLLFFCQSLHALTFAAHHSASLATMQRWFPGAQAARGQGWYTSIGYGVGGSMGALLAALCWEYVAPWSVFALGAVLSAAGGYCAWRSTREPPAQVRVA